MEILATGDAAARIAANSVRSAMFLVIARPIGPRCCRFLADGRPVFDDVVPRIHRAGQQILPMIAVPERIEAECGCRAGFWPRARFFFGVGRAQKPGEKVLEDIYSHDDPHLQLPTTR